MRTFDFTPLFRSTVGFDRLQRVFDAALSVDDAVLSYPPYNIEVVGEDAYRITMAVAGFAEDEIDVTVADDTLVVSSKSKNGEEKGSYLHRGIARRQFERRFDLVDHIAVKGASLSNGLLNIELVREVPEELKPRKIAIDDRPANGKTIEAKAA